MWRDRQPCIAIASLLPRDVLALPRLALIGGLEEPDAVRIRIARGRAGGVGRTFHLMRVYIHGPNRPIGRDDYARPTERRIERLVAAHDVALPCLRVVQRDVAVEGAFGIDGSEDVVGAAVIAADGVDRVLPRAMIARGTAPARI